MFFLFIFALLFIAIITSKIEVEIKNFKYKYINEVSVDNRYKIKIKLLGFGKIPLLWFSLNETKIEKFKKNKRFKNINFENIKRKLKFKNFKKAKQKFDISIKKFDLNAEIGTEDVAFTTTIVPSVSTIGAIFLANKAKKPAGRHFKIVPVYNKRKFFRCIIFRNIFN